MISGDTVNSTFHFKQFKVEDGRSTMKVGTDAVLLAAIIEIDSPGKILEIGTGSGVIALILAQRSGARIDAIEIDRDSVSQAEENARNSPWKGRINIIHSSLQEYANQSSNRYDLIITNPPYFSNSLKSSDKKRNISRHNDTLSFEELITASNKLMTPGGSFWLILPVKEGEEFVEKAVKSGLQLHTKVKILPKTDKKYHRFILHFKKSPAEEILEKVIIIKNPDNEYTDEYRELTKEFYLEF